MVLPIQQPYQRDQSKTFDIHKNYRMEVNEETKVVAPVTCKVIMRLATLDGNVTVTALRANLHELTQYEITENESINSLHTSIQIMLSSRHKNNRCIMSTPYL